MTPEEIKAYEAQGLKFLKVVDDSDPSTIYGMNQLARKLRRRGSIIYEVRWVGKKDVYVFEKKNGYPESSRTGRNEIYVDAPLPGEPSTVKKTRKPRKRKEAA